MAELILNEARDRVNWLPDSLTLPELVQYVAKALAIPRNEAAALTERATRDRQFRFFDKERRRLWNFDYGSALLDLETGLTLTVSQHPLLLRRDAEQWLERVAPRAVPKRAESIVSQAVGSSIGQIDVVSVKTDETSAGDAALGKVTLRAPVRTETAAKKRARLREAAIRQVIEQHGEPPEKIHWATFDDEVRKVAGKKESDYGWADDTIETDARAVMRGQTGQTAK